MSEEFSFENSEDPDDLFREAFGDEYDEKRDSSKSEGEKLVRVVGVFEPKDVVGSVQSGAYVVVLRDSKDRSVLIWIGEFEARAIYLAIQGASADRPLTHDLLNNIINRLDAKVDRILIDDLWNGTYYAKISIIKNDKVMEIDSRPSDAIALSLRANAPIYMAESVIERAAVQEE
ncbi:MAG: bifunctional nuclease family protein [Armatimonadota bacterium]